MCGSPALGLRASLPRTLRIVFMVNDVYLWDGHLFDVLYLNDVALVNWHAGCVVCVFNNQVVLPLLGVQRYLKLVLPSLISGEVGELPASPVCEHLGYPEVDGNTLKFMLILNALVFQVLLQPHVLPLLPQPGGHPQCYEEFPLRLVLCACQLSFAETHLLSQVMHHLRQLLLSTAQEWMRWQLNITDLQIELCP